MNKEQLETNKAALELLLSENGDKCIDYKAQIAQIEKDLKDLGKIALPSVVFDDIYEAVEKGISQFDWSDTDNFEIEYGIDYDGRVNCESHDFRNSNNLVEIIVKEVSKLFAEMEYPEELDTTEDDNHPVVEEITVDGGETEVTVTPTEKEMEDFNDKIEETKEKSFKKRTWF